MIRRPYFRAHLIAFKKSIPSLVTVQRGVEIWPTCPGDVSEERLVVVYFYRPERERDPNPIQPRSCNLCKVPLRLLQTVSVQYES